MAQALEAKRTSPYNSSAFFEEYVNMCSFELDPRAGEDFNAEIITSDDVFDFIFNIRSLNDGIDERREELFAAFSIYPASFFCDSVLRLFSGSSTRYRLFSSILSVKNSSALSPFECARTLFIRLARTYALCVMRRRLFCCTSSA